MIGRYGCIGETLKHSFSKEIHACLAPYSYELFEVAKEDLPTFVNTCPLDGFNVTIPYKETILPHLSHTDEASGIIGAVNTVVRRDGELWGFNTDAYGMKALLDHAGIDVKGKKVLILGTGGTSKTAAYVAKTGGASAVLRVSRSGRENGITYDTACAEHADADVIINTTPCGMYPNADTVAIDISRFPSLSGVIDAVYNPLQTPLIQAAKARGIAAEGGLYMLVAQAARASEHFLHTHYPIGTIDRIYRQLLTQKQNIVLIGMPSSGKTTVGKRLSELLNMPFVDTDACIAERFGMTADALIREKGEKAFRDMEHTVIRDVSAKSGCILATGGGAVLRDDNVQALRSNGRIVFLDRSLENLIPTQDRPLSCHADALRERFSERYDRYVSCADIHIDGNGTVDDVVNQVKRSILTMKIYIINGPNLNMLGIREPSVYGKGSYNDLKNRIQTHAAAQGADVVFYQSNHEGDLVDKIQEAYFSGADGIVINPGAYTHTSVALLDAVKAVGLPTVEVHISDVAKREDFRQRSYIRSACIGTIMGHGFDGYTEAVDMLIKNKGQKS